MSIGFLSELRLEESFGELISTASCKAAYIHALIDTAQPALTWKSLTEKIDHSDLFPLLKDLPEDSAKEAGPVLYPIYPRASKQEREIYYWLLKEEQISPCLTWIISRYPIKELFTHLQSQLFARLPDGREALLRFYDPRILELTMLHVFDQNQRQQLAGPILQWWIWSEGHGRIRIKLS